MVSKKKQIELDDFCRILKEWGYVAASDYFDGVVYVSDPVHSSVHGELVRTATNTVRLRNFQQVTHFINARN